MATWEERFKVVTDSYMETSGKYHELREKVRWYLECKELHYSYDCLMHYKPSAVSEVFMSMFEASVELEEAVGFK